MEKSPSKPVTVVQEQSVFKKAVHKAIGGGLAGSAAMIIQVTSLMWLRTIMNYQYRHGSKMKEAAKKLYQEGGIIRFYRGYTAALAIGPLSRFGDTAANSYAIEFLKDKSWPTSVKTAFGSSLAASFRIILMPIDAIKTSLQVEGKNGFKILTNRVKKHGITTVFNGTVASMSATFVGHYPWFFIYNFLNAKIPKQDSVKYKKLLRSAFIGFCSAVTSDTVSNSLRVLKTTKQTHIDNVTYIVAFREVVKKDGVIGLFGRGLKTRIITNGIQGILFTILWNMFQDMWFKNKV
jgi:hypothetical protein